MSSMDLIVLIASCLSLACLSFLRFRVPLIKYLNRKKRKARTEDLFYVNPRPGRREYVQRHLISRIFFLSRQNNKTFEDKIKFMYGKIFELDNSIEVDTTKVYDANISAWQKVVHATGMDKILGWQDQAKTTIIQFIKTSSTFVKHKIKSMVKRVNKLHRAVTQYIHNNGGAIDHDKK
jgi:hypothetical protein